MASRPGCSESTRTLSHLFLSFLTLTVYVGVSPAHAASAYIRVNQVGYSGSPLKCFITFLNTTAQTERSDSNPRLQPRCLRSSHTSLLRRKVTRSQAEGCSCLESTQIRTSTTLSRLGASSFVTSAHWTASDMFSLIPRWYARPRDAITS